MLPGPAISRIAGIERTRTFVPPSLGISFFRAMLQFIATMDPAESLSRPPISRCFRLDGLMGSNNKNKNPMRKEPLPAVLGPASNRIAGGFAGGLFKSGVGGDNRNNKEEAGSHVDGSQGAA